MINIQQENKLPWIDTLRVIATIGVILLHVSASLVDQYGFITNSAWLIGNFYDSSVRFCVPIFLMISGALLLPHNHELASFLKKRLFRIVLPFMFWSFVYILFDYISNIYPDDTITLLETCKWITQQIQHGASFHLWYVYMIIGIYLFLPIIGKWVRGCNEKEILYFLVIWVSTLFLNQPILSKLKINIDLTYFTGYLGYVVLGYYLSIKAFDNKKLTNRISLLLILVGTGVTAIGTYLLTNYNGKFMGALYSYLSPNVLIVSVGIFLLCKNMFVSNHKIFGIISFISKYSFGIYLVHILILSELYKTGINWKLTNPIFSIPLTSLICLFISGGIVYLVNKLPYGKYISG